MKNIELTEEHEVKLLKMCKKLFSNNKIDYITNGTIKFLIDYYEKPDPNNSKIIFGGWKEIVYIHWFEFCIAHLATVIYNKLGLESKMKISSFRGYLCQDVDNPVDYLYEEFLKLKNDN